MRSEIHKKWSHVESFKHSSFLIISNLRGTTSLTKQVLSKKDP